MHTGDLATIDAEGYCNIVGRLKDMVIRGGESLYPREIEEFLFRHPKVQDVQVIGVRDPKYCEELCACVVVPPGEHLSAGSCAQSAMAGLRTTRSRALRFVNGFPMTVTGKIQKFKLREQMKAQPSLVEVSTA
jgi:fatty-acyl-CoA synthase